MDYRIPYPTLTRDKLSRFVAFRCPAAPKDYGGKIWDACQETDINPGMMACIGMSKSKNFTSNKDVFACHIQGTFEDQVVNAVLQYTHMKPEDLLLPQIQWTSIELKYIGLTSWCNTDNPPDPTPVPAPKPEPKPDPYKPHPNMPDPVPPTPPAPKDPSKPEEPKKKKNLPDWLVKFSVWFGILSGAVVAASWFFPPLKVAVPIIEVIKMIIAAVSGS